MNYRIEHDFLGELQIPSNTLYGIQTFRALQNFHISGTRFSDFPDFIQAFATVKKAAAMANMDLNVLPQEIGQAICSACDELLAGKWQDQFPIDCIQGGAGTSCNMNANEVIANRALELLGHQKGEYQFCHPNNHVNCSQSTNDSYPTSLHITLYGRILILRQACEALCDALAQKAREFDKVIKMGRTQLQDAVPMTLGMEFRSFEKSLRESIRHFDSACTLMLEVNMGATAIGTGICAPNGYASLCVQKLREITGLPFTLADDLISGTWDASSYVQVSGDLRRFAVKLSKICSDLRLMSSGPRAGLNEINLPRLQPGSSIMPGKVNPVIPEVVNQVCFDVIGKDATVAFAAEQGQLELNVMEPIIALSLFEGLERMKNAVNTLRELCINGITANEKHCRELAENSIGIVTALNPKIGYENSASVAKEALSTGASVYDLVLQRGLMTQEELEEALLPENMITTVK
ncbi:MAG: aspartate ammonia-lyase [Desulfovibrionaceae bacterium]|nr:aspartate ammonia-lyase [Desulfovibrionaceae bacterium]